MFKFKGISSTDMQVVIEEEEHFIARAAQRYEVIEIEGRNGAIFNELGYSYVERPIYVQCLNINKIDQILAWLNGEGEFEYKGRKTIARFYSQLDPQRDTCIRIIDTNFIRNPFWNKATEEYQTIKESKIKNANGNPIHISDSSNMSLSYRLNGGDRQETRSGKNKLQLYFSESTKNGVTISENEDGSITLNGTATTSINFMDLGKFLYEVDKGNFKGCITYKNGSVTGAAGLYFSDSTTLGNNKGGVQLNSSNKSFDLNTDVTEDINIYPYIYVNQGVVFNNYTFYFQVINSEVADFEYEKYGAMPSPDYPSEVETVGSNVNELIYPFIDTTKTTNGITFTDNGDGTVTANGTATGTAYFNLSKPTIKPGKHILSGIPEGGSISTYFVKFGTVNVTISYVFDLDEEFTPAESYIRINEGVTVNNLVFKIKLEPGEKATPYSPYGMGSVEIENVNKNFIKIQEMNKAEIGLNISTNKNIVEIDGASTSSTNIYNFFEDIKLKKGTYTFSFISKNAPAINSCLFAFRDINNNGVLDLNGWGETNVKTITLEEDTIISGEKSSFYTNKNTTFNNTKYELQIEKGKSATEIIEPQSQTQIMYTQQEMLEGDYIEDVEHHTWGKIILTGDEGWTLQPNAAIFSTTNLLSNAKLPQNNSTPAEIYCNYFKADSYNNVWTNHTTDNIIGLNSDGTSNPRIYASQFTTTEEFKTWLQEKYNSGNPVVVYYKLAKPKSLPLTEEQKEALEGINTYENVTNISTDNELATLDVEYTAETTEKITNEGNIYSEPIIRLEKTQTEAVEVTINDIRFKYDFNNEEYVEIDCEKKTVEYEGLNRNRQIEIGYDFPKLKVGENEIIMHSGDCVIKVLRKDRWL